MRHWNKLLFGAFGLALQLPAFATDIPVKIYRNPNCGCCNGYAQYLTSQGFAVELINTTDAVSIHEKYGVPQRLEGCHTAVVGPYVFEGLIPAQYVRQVLSENRPIKGLSLPGMPPGAPGMSGTRSGALTVYYLDSSATPKAFATF